MGDVSPRDYYSRQLRVPGWGPEGQERLKQATVLVVGVGGLGCPALSGLVRGGVGRVVLCDPDRVEASNLPRQSLFTLHDVGRPKVEAAASALASANPWVSFDPRPMRLNPSNVRSLIEEADLVIDGSDNFTTKFLLHDGCRAAAKPLVTASVYQWEGHLTVLPFHRPGPGCWRCLYPQPPEDGCVGVCADVGVAGALTAVLGSAQALAGLRLLLDLSGPPRCSTWVFDATDGSSRTLTWKPDPQCDCARGPGAWGWLEGQEGASREVRWEELSPKDRQILVDVRESWEIAPEEWEFFRGAGSEVVHFPWSQWEVRRPEWNPQFTYLLVCAHGIRSLAALQTVPDTITARSLAGGVQVNTTQ